MPRNANGTYVLPAGNPVVPGTLIESTWANPTMSDLGNEITQSLPRNGSAPMTGPLILSRDALLNMEAVTKQQFEASLNATNSYMPAGVIQAFAFSAVPTGWLECNGTAVSRTTYANLFATIGTTYGAGNGVTTFNLPDLRGEFIRGFDNGRSVDPARAFGSNQGAANNPHNHTLTDPTHSHAQAAHNHTLTDPGHTHSYFRDPATGGSQGGTTLSQQMDVPSTTGVSATGISIAPAQPGIAASGTGISIAPEGTEARPRNVAMMYCIKAFGALQTDGLGSMAFQNKEAVNILGGSGVFTTLSCTSAPVNPNDVARLADIGGSLAAVFSSDPSMLLVDNTDPANPILRPQSNVPNGMVKLDANGKVPNALMDPTGYNYQGTWDASGGLLPGGVQLDGSLYYISVAGTLDLFHEDGLESATVCQVGTRIVYVTESPTLPVPHWYYEAASSDPFAVQKTSDTGSALLPAGTQAQRDVVPTVGAIRFSSTLVGWEGWNGTNWVPIGGGQMYGQALVKGIFYNAQTIAENVTVASGENGGSFGPITVADGFTVTVAAGSVWSIV